MIQGMDAIVAVVWVVSADGVYSVVWLMVGCAGVCVHCECAWSLSQPFSGVSLVSKRLRRRDSSESDQPSRTRGIRCEGQSGAWASARRHANLEAACQGGDDTPGTTNQHRTLLNHTHTTHPSPTIHHPILTPSSNPPIILHPIPSHIHRSRRRGGKGAE